MTPGAQVVDLPAADEAAVDRYLAAKDQHPVVTPDS
jgi:hypothetical protein